MGGVELCEGIGFEGVLNKFELLDLNNIYRKTEY